MALSAWHNLNSTSGNSGTIPPQLLPASEIQFKYDYELNFTTYLDTGLYEQFPTAEVHFEVRDASGTLLLEWGFKVIYLLVIADFLYTYYATNITTETTFPIPVVFLGDGNVISGGTGGAALGDVYVLEEFQSPIFKVALPADTACQITFHTAGFGRLPDIESLAVSTLKSSSGVVSGFRHSTDGHATILYPGTGGLRQIRAMGRSRTLLDDRLLTDTSGKAWGVDGTFEIVKAKGGSQQAVIYERAGGIYARISVSDGVSYGNEMATPYAGKSLLGAERLSSGQTLLLMTDSTGAAFAGYFARGNTFSPVVSATLPAGITLALPGRLIYSGGAQVDFFYPDSTGLRHIFTTNDGLTWQLSA